MRNNVLAKLTLFAVTIAASVSVAFADDAEQSPLSVNLDASIYSDYMFRGLKLYDGLSFQPSLQPTYSLGEYGNVSALLFMHISADGGPPDKRFFEMDEAITYDYTFAPFTFSVGNYWYTYPNSNDDIPMTAEIYSAVSIDTVLTPTISYYHDYKVYDSDYFELGLSHTFEYSGEGAYNFTPFVNFGFVANGEKYYASNGLVQSTFGVSTDLPLGIFTLRPLLAYTAKADDNTVNNFWAGTSLSYAF